MLQIRFTFWSWSPHLTPRKVIRGHQRSKSDFKQILFFPETVPGWTYYTMFLP